MIDPIDEIRARHEDPGRATLHGAPPGDWFQKWMTDVGALLADRERLVRQSWRACRRHSVAMLFSEDPEPDEDATVARLLAEPKGDR